MRILIDLQGAQTESRFRGIGRYSLSLALAIARNAGENEVWLALNGAFSETILDIRYAFEGLIPNERIRIFEVPLPVVERDTDNLLRTRIAEEIREYFLQQINADVILITSLFEGFIDNAVTSIGRFTSSTNTVTILYDLIPAIYPEVYLSENGEKNYYNRKIESLKNAGMLLAISESSKRECIAVLGIEENKVINISTAVDDFFHPQKLIQEQIYAIEKKYGISRKILMYAPGGSDSRKNIEGLIEAYSLLSKKIHNEYQLIIVSKINDDYLYKYNKLAKKHGLNMDELVFTGFVDNDDLKNLYQISTLFIFPSKHEGFGLPILEAMACGAPVIGSNTTSIPEVVGWDKALFNPSSPQSIANKIEDILSDEHFLKELKEHSVRQVKLFSWDKSAKLALNALNNLHIKNSEKKITKKMSYEDLIESVSKMYLKNSEKDHDLVLIASVLAFNTNVSNTKQLLIDISVIVHGDAKSGIQRVVRSILFEILHNPPLGIEIKPIYFDGHRYRYAKNFIDKFLNNPRSDMLDDIVDFRQDDIYLALDLNAHLTLAVHDFHKYLQQRGLKLYFIVYDILLVQHPEWWPGGTSEIFEQWLKSIAEVSTGLVCISESVAKEVRKWLEDNKPNRLSLPIIESFHLGADLENSLPSKGLLKNSEVILRKIKERQSYLIVGTVEPRKGHRQTLEAFELLWSDGMDFNLIIIGKEGWLVETLAKKIKTHPELHERLFWLEGISDEYLEKIYEASTCLLATSNGEGFGLPLIEAAQHKIPIIARDLPVFREVAGEHAFYFNNDIDPLTLADAITQWSILYKLGKHKKSDNLPWLTWSQSAQQLLSIIFK